MSPLDPELAPVGEEIHLPGPSLLPVGLAVGLTLSLIGVTISPIFIVIGVLLSLWVLLRWLRDTRHDIDELPLEQHR